MLKFYICIGLFSKEPEAFSCQLKAAVLSLMFLRRGKKFKAFLNLVVSRLRNDKSNLKKLNLSQFFWHRKFHWSVSLELGTNFCLGRRLSHSKCLQEMLCCWISALSNRWWISAVRCLAAMNLCPWQIPPESSQTKVCVIKFFARIEDVGIVQPYRQRAMNHCLWTHTICSNWPTGYANPQLERVSSIYDWTNPSRARSVWPETLSSWFGNIGAFYPDIFKDT